MKTRINLWATAAVIAVAAAANVQAVKPPPPPTVTNVIVLQSVSVTLTAVEPGVLVTNKKETVITDNVTNVSISTKDVIKAIGLATTNHFSSAAMLIKYTSYSQTNGWEYEVFCTNATAFGENVTIFPTNLLSTEAEISFLAPYTPGAGETSNILISYPITGLGASNFNFGDTNAGFTNNTALLLKSNTYYLGKTMSGYEIIDGKNTVVLSNNFFTSTIFSLGASPDAFSGSEKAANGVAIYDTQTGTAYGTGSMTLNGINGAYMGWTLSLDGAATTTYYSDNAEPTGAVVGPEYYDYGTISLNAYGLGRMYFGPADTNYVSVIIKSGTVTTSLYKTISSP